MNYTIHPIITARLAVEAGRITYLRNYGERLWLPCPCYLIKGGPSGPMLVDTSGQAEVLSRYRQEPVEPVAGFTAALEEHDVALDDIEIVIHTHLMYDHCANSTLLPKARFVVQKKELEFAEAPHPMFAGAYQRELFAGLPFQTVDGDAELLSGIDLLFTPGHSPGGQSVAVATAAGTAVITGFCCTGDNFDKIKNQAWTTEIVPDVVPPGIHTDMLQAYESTLRVKSVADLIIPFHDPVICGFRQIPDSHHDQAS